MKTYTYPCDGYTEIEFTNRDGRTVASKRVTGGQSKLSAPLRLNNEDTLAFSSSPWGEDLSRVSITKLL